MNRILFSLFFCFLFFPIASVCATQVTRPLLEDVVKTENGVRVTLYKDDVTSGSKPRIYLNEILIEPSESNRDIYLSSKDKLKIESRLTVYVISISENQQKGLLFVQHTTHYLNSNEVVSGSFYYPIKAK